MGTTVKKMMCFLVICSALTSRAMCRGFEAGAAADSKAYYSPPSTTSPHRSHRGSGTPTTNPPSTGGDAPASHGSPPSGGGGGYYSPPSTGGDAPPSGGGGGYYNPPSSTPVVVPTPTTPVVVPTPTTPVVVPTPTTPVVVPPGTPFTPVDPNCPPFTFDYWRCHPNAIWSLFGFWCPVAQIFGLPNPAAFASTNPTVMDALANTRRDGIGELYREATAAFLNSLVDHHFYFTGEQVRDSFRAAVVSDKEASAQAQLFKQANEGRLKRG
ncbi:protodermal factor 1-like [Zingiber officinale]|uniref:Protodermal factor 1 n=1 Tax=Zingiber officinale TaxID=94328 RepID=A0A8J5HWB8_ZINOF|nr:protodermal factor 1-like [Zingiber officinale]KAG6526624.1 hypothetical protein ZIOFF_016616 [Zingiber officinale]